MSKHWRAVLILCAFFLFAGCSLFDGEDSATDAGTPTPAQVTLTPPPTPQLTPQATEAVAGPPEPIVLNIWLVETISPYQDSPASRILQEQIRAFETNLPEISLNVEVKAPTGRGGILSYIRFGQDVAPGILPDLIVIPTDTLAQASAEELIQPLDGLLAEEMINDLIPAAQALSMTGDQIVGYPIMLEEVTHLAYNTDAITTTLPLEWGSFIDQETTTFVFPGAGTPGSNLLLQFYLALGGTLTDEVNQTRLEVDPLANALSQLARGQNDGLIVPQSANLNSFEESWQAYSTGLANTVQTDRPQFTQNRTESSSHEFAPLPGPTGPLPVLVKGWAWAVSTNDPSRQALAAQLLNWLAAGPNVGEWSLAAGKLPARRSAFELWPSDDLYVEFLISELEASIPYPVAANSALLTTLNTALFDVLSGTKSPQAAAEEAAASVQ